MSMVIIADGLQHKWTERSLFLRWLGDDPRPLRSARARRRVGKTTRTYRAGMNVFPNGIFSDPESLVTGSGRERMPAQARPSAETIASGR